MKNIAIIIGNMTWIAAAVAAGIPTFFGIVSLIASNSDRGWFSAIREWALMGGIAGFISGCCLVYETRPRRKQ